MATSSETGGPAPAATEKTREPPTGSLREPAPLQRDVRPRAGHRDELKKRDRWMAWGFVVAMLVAIALIASWNIATP